MKQKSFNIHANILILTSLLLTAVTKTMEIVAFVDFGKKLFQFILFLKLLNMSWNQNFNEIFESRQK